jgi:hypothetical protein
LAKSAALSTEAGRGAGAPASRPFIAKAHGEYITFVCFFLSCFCYCYCFSFLLLFFSEQLSKPDEEEEEEEESAGGGLCFLGFCFFRKALWARRGIPEIWEILGFQWGGRVDLENLPRSNFKIHFVHM